MEKSKGIPGSTVKIIAMLSMVIDHFAAVVLTRMYMLGGYSEKFYGVIILLRLVGRLAFPIYCFLLVEGFQRTKDVKGYMLRMVFFALAAEIPFDLALTGQAVNWGYQNVMFTMLIGLAALRGLKLVEEKGFSKWRRILLQAVVIFCAVVLAEGMKVDYSWSGILCICAIYLLKASNVRKVLLGNAVLIIANTLEIAGLFSVPIIKAYNGERGLKIKYFFYAFYPLHLLILYIICVLLGIGDVNTLQY